MKSLTPLLLILLFACSNPASNQQDSSVPVPKRIPANLSPVPLPQSKAGAQQGEPFLFTSPDGEVYLSWIETTDSLTHRLQFARLADSAWTTPVTIASGRNWFVNWADYPQMATDGEGHFMATWLQKSGKGTYAYDIMMSTSNGGVIWTDPVTLNEDGKEAEHGFVSIAPYPGKGFLVSWLDGRLTKPMPAGSHDHEGHGGGAMTLRVATFDTAGRKTGESEVDNRTCDCCQTSIAVGSSGPVVVYRDRSENETRDIWKASMLDGKWQTPEPVSLDQWIINGCPVNGPHLEVNGNRAAVAWFTSAKNSAGVYTAFSSDGGRSFREKIRVHDSLPLGRVDLVLADSSTAMVSWMEGGQILARAVHADGETGPVYFISKNSAARSAGFPQMTLSGKKLVFAWTDADTKRIMTAVMVL
ncbi:MAG: hypothetical protein MUE58_10040 [Chitinophagaceae bacterium]|nr:hypothetical protein [Chitinophagaceae bacterium]